MIAFLRKLFGLDPTPGKPARDAAFASLNRHAPVKEPAPGAPSRDENTPTTVMCREAVLDREQKVAGYQFLHHEGTRHRLHNRSRSIRHIYAEVLVRSLVQFSVDRLLGHRMAFLDVPDSFLGHPSLAELDGKRMVLVLEAHDDEGAPDEAQLREWIVALRQRGVRFGLMCDHLSPRLAPLLADADFLVFTQSEEDPGSLARRMNALHSANANAALLVRNLASHDEFNLVSKLSTRYFQGPFVTSREPWESHELGPNTARLADLLARLKRDAETQELAEALKHDGALSVRLLRYINSAAVGLPEKVTSFERALQLLGRDKLHRWLTLLMLSADNSSPRAAAVLESAMVRARMMELLGRQEPPEIRDGLFMTGLLSLIDVVLELPMGEAMVAFAPSPDITAAILDGEGRLADLLALARACEQSDPTALAAAAEHSGIDAEAASRCHFEALAWALEVSE